MMEVRKQKLRLRGETTEGVGSDYATTQYPGYSGLLESASTSCLMSSLSISTAADVGMSFGWVPKQSRVVNVSIADDVWVSGGSARNN
jgi:hypothetical protein